MEGEWEELYFDVLPYKNTGTFIQKISDETLQLLDDQIVMTQSICFSPYKAEFELRIDKWEKTLRTTQVIYLIPGQFKIFIDVLINYPLCVDLLYCSRDLDICT